MRKKYLSALLFGALLFASAGTFTSCKDYDDDINGLRTEITDLKSAVEELQQKIGDGKFVTNVVANGQGLTISWNDGSSTTIENVINEATGETGEGSVVTFDEATGEILINGEGTGYYASKSEIGEYKAPYVNADGALVLVNEEGEEVVTDILAAPVTAVENADGSVTLTIRANGTTQTVLIPSAASSITGISLLDAQGNTITNINDLSDLDVNYWVVANGANWKGPRGNIPAKSVVYSSKAGNIYFNLDPAGVDATEMSFNLINSHDEVAPLKLVAPEGDEKLMSRASTYQNGLYITGVSERSEIFTYTNGVTDFTGEFKEGNNTVLFALAPQAEGVNVRSPYYVGVATDGTESATLTNVIITGANDDAGNTQYSARIEGKGTATIRVGRPAEVTVTEEYKLYDLYMEVTEAAKDKFGLVIDNEARTIEATKSPDDLTDASFELVVYAMDNAGHAYKATTFTVTVNRSMAESAYEKQTKALTKRDDTFAVPATPLFNGLGDQLNDWKESVNLKETKFELLEMDENGDLVTATEGYSSFKGYNAYNPVQWVATQVAPANGYVAFLNSENKVTNSAASLANIQFNLNIPQSGSPIKIDKDYYVRLTFYSNEGVVLNTTVVPFVLTKPELSTILVKESGVFRDGDNLAYAYMYWGDAYMNADKADGLVKQNSDGSAASIYYIDRAFTDLYKHLDTAGITNYEFALDKSTNIAGSEKSNAFADYEYNSTETSGRPRAAIHLKDRDNDGNGIIDGYKKDLIVNFTGHYLDVQDDSYKYTDTYKFRVMSPILEGEAIAANNLVQVNATGRTKLYKEDIWAKTYNNDEVYNIFAKGGTNIAPEWYRADINNVTFDTANKNVFEVTVATPTAPTKDASGKVIDSYIEVEGVSAN